MFVSAQGGICVVLLLHLLSSVSDASERPVCGPAKNCKEKKASEDTFYYEVNGQKVTIQFADNDFFSMSCVQAENVTVDDPSLPAFQRVVRVQAAEFILCALPVGSYANALLSLNINVTESLTLQQPTGTPLNHTHSAGLNVDKLTISGRESDTQQILEDNFLSKLQLKSLELYNLNLSNPLTFRSLPVSLLELELNQLSYPKIEDDAWLERLQSLTSLVLYDLNEEKTLLIDLGKLAGLPNLTTIDFLGVPTKLQQGSLDGSALRHLTLRSCGLSLLENETFKGVNLTLLDLDNNGLTDLPNGVFSPLEWLEELDLSNNKLKAESLKDTLPALKRLKKLSVNYNPLGSLCGTSSFIKGRESSELPSSLQYLSLQKTNADRICYDWVTDSALTDIDLKDNNIENLIYNEDLVMKRTLAKPVVLHLEKNPLKKVHLTSEDVQECKKATSAPGLRVPVHLEMSKGVAITCDCKNAWFREALTSCASLLTASDLTCSAWTTATPPEIYSTLQKYKPDQLLCPYQDSCVPGCFCWSRARGKATVMWCEGPLPKEPVWPASIARWPLVLHAPGVGLDRIPTGVLEELHISNNTITSLSAEYIPDTLRVLDLRDNLITQISEMAALRLLRPSLRVNLSGNPLRCDCENSAALLHLKTAKDQVTDLKTVKCDDHRLVLELTAGDLCPSMLWPIFSGVLGVIVVALMVMVAILPRLRILIKQFFINHGMFLKLILNVRNIPNDPSKDNDVFLSYAYPDLAIATKLLQELQARGYATLDHCRDFHPGCTILENISEFIKRSRIIILLVTDNYAKSKWCMNEFRTAHSVSIKGDTARVLVLLYPLSDPKNVPQDMQVYLQSNTYIIPDDVYFWKKIEAILGKRHPKEAADLPVQIEMEAPVGPMQVQSENELELVPLAGNDPEAVNHDVPSSSPTKHTERSPPANRPAPSDRPPTPSLAYMIPPSKTPLCTDLIEFAQHTETVAC